MAVPYRMNYTAVGTEKAITAGYIIGGVVLELYGGRVHKRCMSDANIDRVVVEAWLKIYKSNF